MSDPKTVTEAGADEVIDLGAMVEGAMDEVCRHVLETGGEWSGVAVRHYQLALDAINLRAILKAGEEMRDCLDSGYASFEAWDAAVAPLMSGPRTCTCEKCRKAREPQ